MAQVFLGLGSNIDRERHLQAGLDALSAQFGALNLSPVYESEAVGFQGDPFFNLVVAVETSLSPGALSQALKGIEDDNGRERHQPGRGARTLDIDILTYDNLCGVHEGVELPRAEVLINAFVLLPLSQLAPDARHPLTGRTYAEHWSAYSSAQVLRPVHFCWQPLHALK